MIRSLRITAGPSSRPPRLCLAGVQPHPYAEGSGLLPGLLCQTALGSQAGANRIDCRSEDGHQAIASGLDQLPAGSRHRSLQDRVVALQRTLQRQREALPRPLLPSTSVNRKVKVRDTLSGSIAFNPFNRPAPAAWTGQLPLGDVTCEAVRPN
jgi:hypothetical protein